MSDESLPARERFEAAMAREGDPGWPEGPSRSEIAQDEREHAKLWPVCRRCSRKTLPGMKCDDARCPWHLVDGRIIEAGRL